MMMGVTLVLAIIGFGVGIVINALSDAMPIYRRPRRPEYPDGSARPPIAWSGVLAYLMQKHVNEAGSKLTWRHPFTEIFSVLLFIWIPLGYWGIDATRGFVWLVYLSIFLLIMIIDIEHHLILFPVILPAIGISFVLSMLFPSVPSRFDHLLGAGLALGIFLAMYIGGDLFGRLVKANTVPFGFGDVMLAALAGMIIGIDKILVALFVAVMLGGLGALVYLIILKARGNFDRYGSAIPYGPFIILGTVLFMM